MSARLESAVLLTSLSLLAFSDSPSAKHSFSLVVGFPQWVVQVPGLSARGAGNGLSIANEWGGLAISTPVDIEAQYGEGCKP